MHLNEIACPPTCPEAIPPNIPVAPQHPLKAPNLATIAELGTLCAIRALGVAVNTPGERRHFRAHEWYRSASRAK